MNELENLKNELKNLEEKKNKNANDLIKIKDISKKIKKFTNNDNNKSIGVFVHNNIVEYISIDLIKPNPYQPRKVFNENLIELLAESIAEEGLIQPIIVVKNDNGYILVAGERRLRACKKLGEQNIKAIVDTNYSLNDLKLKAIIENLAREDLCLADEAISLKSLSSNGLSYSKIASKVSKSKTHISRMLNIALLNDECLNYIRQNDMKQTNSIEVIALSQKSDNEKLKLLISLNEKELQYKDLKELLDTKKDNIVPTRNTIKIENKIEGIKISPLDIENKRVKIEFDFNKLEKIDKDEIYNLIENIKNKFM